MTLNISFPNDDMSSEDNGACILAIRESWRRSSWLCKRLQTFNDLTYWLHVVQRNGKRHGLSRLSNLKESFDGWTSGGQDSLTPFLWVMEVMVTGNENTLISVSNVKIQLIESQGQTETGISAWLLQCVQTACSCIGKNVDGIASFIGTCWCSILMSVTSLWSSSCSLLSSSQACFTWLCSLTSWMLSCLNTSSSSFSCACSPARRLCSVLRR